MREGKTFNELRTVLCNNIKAPTPCNLAIQGVTGVGKTTLLQEVFSTEFRKEIARNYQLVIPPATPFPEDVTDNDAAYTFFQELLMKAADVIEDENVKKELLKKNELSAKVAALKALEYFIVFVVDDFERFTQSFKITDAFHATCFNLSQHQSVRYIVATSVGLNSEALPKETAGSLFLQLFGENVYPLQGWSREEYEAYLAERYAKPFDEAVAKTVWENSGGIPEIVQQMCAYALEKTDGRQTDGLKFKVLFEEEAMKAVLKQWAAGLSKPQVEALIRLAYGNDAQGDRENIFPDLRNRAILREDHSFACSYFAMLCKTAPEQLRAWAEENPLTQWQWVKAMFDEQLKNGASKEEVFETMNRFCRFIPGVSSTTDVAAMTVELPESTATLFSQSQDVQDLIEIGLKWNKLCENNERTDFDYTVMYRPYSKAMERYLNQTLVPLMKAVASEARDLGGQEIASWSDDVSVRQIYHTLFDRQVGIHPSVAAQLECWCKDNGLANFPSTWWSSLKEDLKWLTEEYESVAQSKAETEDKAASYLAVLRAGKKKLFKKCKALYDAANSHLSNNV